MHNFTIPLNYKGNPLRLVLGAEIDIDKKTYETVVFVEAEIELEEWKNLSEAVKAYKEKRRKKSCYIGKMYRRAKVN